MHKTYSAAPIAGVEPDELATLRWAMKLVPEGRCTRPGLRWPAPGEWLHAEVPFAVAATTAGLAPSGAPGDRFLLVAFRPADVIEAEAARVAGVAVGASSVLVRSCFVGAEADAAAVAATVFGEGMSWADVAAQTVTSEDPCPLLIGTVELPPIVSPVPVEQDPWSSLRRELGDTGVAAFQDDPVAALSDLDDETLRTVVLAAPPGDTWLPPASFEQLHERSADWEWVAALLRAPLEVLAANRQTCIAAVARMRRGWPVALVRTDIERQQWMFALLRDVAALRAR